MKGISRRLTKKEKEILTVLWNTDAALTVSEIYENAKSMDIELNLSTIQMTVKKMLEDNLLIVDSIIKANRSLARSFKPAFSENQLAVLEFRRSISRKGNVTNSGMIAALLESIELSEADIEDLSNMIEELRNS